MLFTGFHDDYHRPEDDIEFIDIPGMARVAEAALEIIRRTQSVDRLTYNPPGK
jgi:di/tripeptidase